MTAWKRHWPARWRGIVTPESNASTVTSGNPRALRVLARLCRPVGFCVVLVAVLGIGGVGVLYAISEWKLHRSHDAPLVPMQVTGRPDLIEGERMARLVGCWDGCHGRTGQGGQEEVRGIVRHTAPTLSQVIPLYTDDELVRLIRYGLKRDGKNAVGMTS